ncbi:hypothetical protein LLEC1_02923 [Akanthomyces lecanii]|uniref:Carrier domain-containing protein n=1 Tax=Cordyceps confragosa TaxID=2714763 RepID=A0A179IJ89_CORDF|nr:hypothetical protein LLEC1_02923 [Akanthomyces lecanii]
MRKLTAGDSTTPTPLATPPFSLLSAQCASKTIGEVAERLCVDRSEIEDIYPCTPFQEDQMARTVADSPASVVQSTYALRRNCAVGKLQAALRAVCTANTILRTRIIKTDTGIVQAVLRGQPELIHASDLKTYLALDRALGMCLDQTLLRVALITETDEVDDISAKCHLVISIHHALHDEWSEALILEQLEAAYGGAALPTRQFASFVKYIQDSKSHSKLFWRKELAQRSTPAATFPPAHPPGYQAAPDAISSCFLEFATEHKFSQFKLETQLRLAWALVIHHYTSSDVVVFGTVVDGRAAMVSGIEAITGPTMTTIPCKVHVNSSLTVDEALYNIQDASYWSLPFQQLGLKNMEKLSDSALEHCKFQSLLVIRPRKTPNRSCFLRRIPERSTAPALGGTYPLTIECKILTNSVELRATYDAELLLKAMMQRLLQHYKYTVKEVASKSSHTIAQIRSVSSYDMAQLTEWHNELQEDQPQRQLLVHKLIEHQCHSKPMAVAVHAWDGDFSYREVELLSSRLAAELVEEGVRAESNVPICFEKSKWLAVIMLAVVKAGAAFVLLDPSSQPLERMQLMVIQVKAKLILCSKALLSIAVQMPATRSLLVADGAPCFRGVTRNPRYLPAITEKTALYVIFTSGSTGTPKGVVIEHGGYAAGALSRCKVTGLNHGSRVLQFSSCTFDTFITDILDTLIAGACICVPSESACRSGLAQAARDMGVTYADLVPSVARLIISETISTLKTLVLSGEPATKTDVCDWADKVRLCNLYGPAECSAVATGHAYSGSHSHPANIGRVCGGTCWVVKPTDPDVLLPIGAVGELVVEGNIVGRGYLGQVDEQASSNFLTHLPPWRHEFPGVHGDTRMYKTGDLVQYHEDGTLLFIGRKDDQVKLHGQRLELGEVEHHLRDAFPASVDVVAAIIASPIERLVAFVVVGNAVQQADDAALSLDEQALVGEDIHIVSSRKFQYAIRSAEKLLRERLPTYMVPTVYFPIRQLPRTSSGKVNRGRLQQAASQLLLQNRLSNFTAAREKRNVSTGSEKLLQSIWAQVLGVEPSAISAEDGFLGLGGDSISAMRVAALAESHGLNISAPKMFQNESLRNLTATIDSHTASRRILWEEEVAFPPQILAAATHHERGSVRPHRESPVGVLLTGATGRLGQEILHRLMECDSISAIHCIAVRCAEKLLPHEKVIVYRGDLSRPRLGMSKNEEADVLQSCQAIIHCGATLSFVQNYEMMRSVNVESTKYLAALALRSYMPFHYISTAGVGQQEGHAVIEEASAAWNEPPADGADGYTASKWVSEVFLEKVNSRFGLDVTIHRPSNILCDGDPETDIVNNLLEYSRRIKAVPQLDGWEGHFDFVRSHVAASNIVESLMTSLVRIAQDGRRSSRSVQYIHESGETVIPIDSLSAYVAKDEDVPFKTIDMREWVAKAIQEGMASIVGDFLCDMQDTGERITLPLIKTSRLPFTG